MPARMSGGAVNNWIHYAAVVFLTAVCVLVAEHGSTYDRITLLLLVMIYLDVGRRRR